MTSPASSQVVQGDEMVVVPKNPLKIASNPKPNPQIPQWPLARGVSLFRDVSPERGYPRYHNVSPQRRVSSLPWCQPTEGVSPFRDIRPWRGLSILFSWRQPTEGLLPLLSRAISAFWKIHKCKLIPNGTRETLWLFSNNVNIKIFACRQIFIEAIFSCSQNFRHHFTWYHFLRNFPIVFHSIIIQNYDV